MKNNLDVLLVGANFSNKGAEAMLKTVRDELQKRSKSVRCFMVCRQYEKQLAEQSGFVPLFEDSTTLSSHVRSFLSRLSGKLYKTLKGKDKPYVFHFPFQEIEKQIKNLDMVIDISGFAYGDSWGIPLIEETIKLQQFCKKYKAKYYFFPQAWGSFDNPALAPLAKQMILNSQKYYARDLISQEYLAGVLNKNKQEISLLPDIALIYNGKSEELGREVLSMTGYKKNKRLLVGISPNLRVYERTDGDGLDNEYVKTLLKLSEYCLEDLDADIIFIPNEVFPDSVSAKDDRYICKMLHEFINQPERCFSINSFPSSEEVKSVISQLNLLISSRFHALIFGISAGLPVMAISWSHKYKELFSLFNIQDFVMEWHQLDEKKALDLFKRFYMEQDIIRQNIINSIGPYKEKVEKLFDEVVGEEK